VKYQTQLVELTNAQAGVEMGISYSTPSLRGVLYFDILESQLCYRGSDFILANIDQSHDVMCRAQEKVRKKSLNESITLEAEVF